MKYVLITGVTGFLGRHVLDYLYSKGYNIKVFIRESSNIDFLKDYPRCKIFKGDILDKNSWAEALEDSGALIHLAACVSLAKKDHEERFNINVVAVRKMIAALCENPVKLIYCSSIGTIGSLWPNSSKVFTELEPYRGRIHYFQTKRLAENLVEDFVRKGQGEAIIVNPGTLIGKGMGDTQSRFFKKIIKHRLMVVPSGGTCLTSVRDCAKGIQAALEKGQSGSKYILGGKNYSFKDYGLSISYLLGKKRTFLVLPGVLLRSMAFFLEKIGTGLSREVLYLASGYSYYSSEKATNELGYEITPLSQTLQEITDGIVRDKK